MPPWWGRIHADMKTRNPQNYCNLLWISFRSIFLKLALLGIYVYFIFKTEQYGEQNTPTVSQKFSVRGYKLTVTLLFVFCFFSAGRTSWVERCTNWSSSTSLPPSAMLFYSTSPESELVWGRLFLWQLNERQKLVWSFFFFIIILKFTHFVTFLSGYCRKPAPHPCWPGCPGNSASWSRSTSWTWCMCKQCRGWECTTALCCLWLELSRW